MSRKLTVQALNFSEFTGKLSGNMTDFIKDGWFVKPVAISNQDLFHVNYLFMKEMSCSPRQEFETFCVKFPIKRRRHLRRQITSSVKYSIQLLRVDFTMSGSIEFTPPDNAEVTATDAIIKWGPSFT